MSQRLIVPLLLLAHILLTGCGEGIVSSVEARNGVIDLSGHSSSVVELAGMWQFIPGEFVSPGNLSYQEWRIEKFPASWTNYEPPVPAHHWGTYRLQIIGLDPEVCYAFRFPGYSSAARYFVNGTGIYAQGIPGPSRATEQPEWNSVSVVLSCSGVQSIDLVIHLSNFNDLMPATTEAVSFGPREKLISSRENARLLLIIPFGAILAMGMFFISLYVFHRGEYAALWLGLLCAAFAVRMLCYDEFMLRYFIPSVSVQLQFRLGYFTFAVAPALFMAFVYALFPSITPRWTVWLVAAVSSLYGAMNLFMPPLFFIRFLQFFQLFVAVCGLYIIALVVIAAFSRLEGARLFLFGFALFFAVVIRDILIANRILQGRFLGHFGILAIVFAMALLLVRRLTGAFTQVEQAQLSLEQTNLSLARFVPNDFLRYLNKHSITDITLGDNIQKRMCVMFIHLGVDIPLYEIEARINLLEMLNEVLLHITPVIQRYQGFVDKYLSEGLMVLFPEDAEPALRCAVEIGEVMMVYNQERLSRDLPEIRFAVGLHRGQLMLGTIGEQERMDGTVISDVVNMASRLMGFALGKQLPMALSDEFLPDIGPDSVFIPESLGQVHLKGKEHPVSIYQVVLK